MELKDELLEKIKASVTALGQRDQDDFDSLQSSLAILHAVANLLRLLYDNGKIKQWKSQDDPAFYRFASKLKVGLELQRDYLNSISDSLISDDDIVSKKIMSCQEQINSILEKEKSILKKIAPLLEKEHELNENKKRLDLLLEKQRNFEEIEQKLSGINLQDLTAEVEEKEKGKTKLEVEYQPLLEKRDSLVKEVNDFREAVQNLTRELDGLEEAYGEDAAKLAENIPKWIQTIKNRKVARKQKDKKYITDLEREAEELKKVENQLQEHIQKFKKFASLSTANDEILRVHFESNKTLGDRFSKSLPDIKYDLAQLTEAIEKQLKNFDETLMHMQKRIEEAAAEFKPIGLGR